MKSNQNHFLNVCADLKKHALTRGTLPFLVSQFPSLRNSGTMTSEAVK